MLTKIQQNPELGDIDMLGQNLDVIRNGYKPQNKSTDGKRIIDVSDAINKLYDHVNLDIARINYSDAADRRISGEESLNNLQIQINELQNEIKKVKSVKEDISHINSLINKNKRIAPLIISNIIIIILMTVTIVAWYIGMIESRNDRMEVKQGVVAEQMEKQYDKIYTNLHIQTPRIVL